MKKVLTILAVTSTLVFTNGCANQVQSSQKDTSNTETVVDVNSHKGHNMGDGKTHEMGENSHGGHGDHGSHSSLESAGAVAKLSLPAKIAAKTPVNLIIDVQDKDGKPISKFDKFQEQLMHLIVVSDNLEYFNHVHPIYKENGRFEIDTDFPASGGYTLFSDYKVAGKAEQVSALKLQIPGENSSTAKIDFSHSKTFDKTKVNLKLSQPIIKAGQEVSLIFSLLDTNNKPVKDLQNYLGEKGHLVILKQSPKLTEADYIHAHAMKNKADGEIHFMTKFPQPGKYKMWGQFNRGGKIITADFWVDVK